MKYLLIISSTKNSNFDLSQKIKSFFDNKDSLTTKIISLEDFDLPLYTPSLEETFKAEKNFPDEIKNLKEILLESHSIIWCSPEYNGGISPIVTNAIAWISRATVDWKDAFNNKNMLICSSSGGNGKSFVEGFKIQLKYLGSDVMGESLIQTKKNTITDVELDNTLSNFYLKIIN